MSEQLLCAAGRPSEGSLSLSIAGMGLASMLMQIMSLRRLLSLFAGNELVIGVTFAVWIALVGLGSMVGSRFRSDRTFAYSFVVVALLAVPTVLVPDYLPTRLGLQPGEILPFSGTVLTAVLTLLPLCTTLGIQFPLAVGALSGNASRAYGLEAAGACLGGLLFTREQLRSDRDQRRIDLYKIHIQQAVFQELAQAAGGTADHEHRVRVWTERQRNMHLRFLGQSVRVRKVKFAPCTKDWPDLHSGRRVFLPRFGFQQEPRPTFVRKAVSGAMPADSVRGISASSKIDFFFNRRQAKARLMMLTKMASSIVRAPSGKRECRGPTVSSDNQKRTQRY